MDYLYPIPVLLTQYVDNEGSQPNLLPSSDMTSWQLAKRFFLVDDTPLKNGPTNSIRYASQVTLTVRLQNDRSTSLAGAIYVPYFSISYSDAEDDQSLSTTFSVDYTQEWDAFLFGYLVAVAACCGVAILFTFLRTWSWSKRAGKVSIDCVALIKFCVYLCAYIGNLFLGLSAVSAMVLFLTCKVSNHHSNENEPKVRLTKFS